jgi:hypothetical protein
MDATSIDAVGETVSSPAAPSPPSEEPRVESAVETPPPETSEGSGKILDLYV